jgi:hypothetical protein
MKRIDLGMAALVAAGLTVSATALPASATTTAGAPDTCIQGFVWRETRPSDHVCVTPQVREQARRDNQVRFSRWVAGPSGPHTCISGYVWREAFPGDDVCVTPAVRRQARADNTAAASRRAADLKQKTFTWNRPMMAGDCQISSGATWTLYSNGAARLDATAFSLDGDDAWLMWARLLDEDRAVLGEIRVVGSSSTKFVKNLPVRFRRYRWLAEGRFDPDLFDQVKHMSLSKHC